MRPESSLPTREKRGGGADIFLGRQSPARPIPTRVGVRKPASTALPPALAPKRIEFRWKLVWDESVKALIPETRPEPVARPTVAQPEPADIPRFAMIERPHEPEPESAPRSTLTTLALATEEAETAVESGPASLTESLREAPPATSGWMKWLAVIIVAAGSIGGYVYFTSGGVNNAGSPGARKTSSSSRPLTIGAPIAMAPAGWRSMPAEDDSGIASGRRFSLYRTVAPMVDYIVEFQGQVLTKSLGWVVRVSDSKNYYALKLELVKTDPMPEVELVRFAVVGGEQGTAKRIPIQTTVRNRTLKVRVDVVGPRITTYVDGRAVDFWNDTRLHSGTFGFMNDKEGRAEIKSVRVSSPGSPAGN